MTGCLFCMENQCHEWAIPCLCPCHDIELDVLPNLEEDDDDEA